MQKYLPSFLAVSMIIFLSCVNSVQAEINIPAEVFKVKCMSGGNVLYESDYVTRNENNGRNFPIILKNAANLKVIIEENCVFTEILAPSLDPVNYDNRDINKFSEEGKRRYNLK
jgi:hypothetical protein